MFRRSFRKKETPNLEYESSEINHNEEKDRNHQKLKKYEVRFELFYSRAIKPDHNCHVYDLQSDRQLLLNVYH